MSRHRGEVVSQQPGQTLEPPGEAVEGACVQPEHPGLGGGRARCDRGTDGLDGAGERGVVMRVVTAPDDALGADEGSEGGQRALADLEADGALAGEVFRGAQPQFGAETSERLGLLVEALEPEGRPAARGFEEHDPQSRVALEDSEGDQLRAGEHRLEGVGHRVEDQRVEGPVGAESRHRDRAALVHADGDVELFCCPPQGLVGRMGEGATGAGVGPDEAGDEAEFGDRPPQLVGRRSRILQREESSPEEPAGSAAE